jgi:hypothetical protein
MVLILKKGASKKEMYNIIAKLPVVKGVNTRKYCGAIIFKEDALVLQKQMRNEWQ